MEQRSASGHDRWGKAKGYLAKRFRNDAATECRLIGAFIGLLSFVLPWGSIIYHDGTESVLYIDQQPLTLLGSGDAVLIVGAALFIIFTALAFFERLAALGQFTGALFVAWALPSYLNNMPKLAEVNGAVVTARYNGAGLGMVLGIISGAVILVSLYVERRQGRFPVEETLPNDQRPVENHTAWPVYQRFEKGRQP
jgi:hypothetical protein